MNKKYQLVKYDSVQVPSGYIMGEITAKEAILYLKAISAPAESILKVKQIEIAKIEHELAGVEILKGWYTTDSSGEVKDAKHWNSQVRRQFAEMGNQAGTNDKGRSFYFMPDNDDTEGEDSYTDSVAKTGYYDERPQQRPEEDPQQQMQQGQQAPRNKAEAHQQSKKPHFVNPKDIKLTVESAGHDRIRISHDSDGIRDLAEKIFVVLAAFGDRAAAVKFANMVNDPKEGDSLEIALPQELQQYQSRIIESINNSEKRSITDTMNEIFAESNYKLVVADDVRDILKHSLKHMASLKDTSDRLTIINELSKELDMIGIVGRSGLSRQELSDEFPLLGDHITDGPDGELQIDAATPATAFLHVSALIPSKNKLFRRFLNAMTEGQKITSINSAVQFRANEDKIKFNKEVDALAAYIESTGRKFTTAASRRKRPKTAKDKIALAIKTVSSESEHAQLQSYIQAYEAAQGTDSNGVNLEVLKSASNMLNASLHNSKDAGFETNMAYIINSLSSFSTSAYVRVSSIQNKGFPDMIKGMKAANFSLEDIVSVGRLAAFGKASPFQRTGDGKIFFNYQGESIPCTPNNKEMIMKLSQDIIENGMESGEAMSNTLRVSGQFADMKNPPKIDFDDDSPEVERALGDISDQNSTIRQVDFEIAKALKNMQQMMGFTAKGGGYATPNDARAAAQDFMGDKAEQLAKALANEIHKHVRKDVNAHNAGQIREFAEHQAKVMMREYGEYLMDKADTMSKRSRKEVITTGKSLGSIFEGMSDISLLVQKTKALQTGENIHIPKNVDTGEPLVMGKFNIGDFDPQRIDPSVNVPMQGTLFEVRDLNGITKERCFIGKDIRSSGSVDSFLLSAKDGDLRIMPSETKIYAKEVAYGHYNAPDQFAAFIGAMGRNYRSITFTNTTNKSYMYNAGRVDKHGVVDESLQRNSHSDKLRFKAYQSFEDGGENSAVLSGIPLKNDGTTAEKDTQASLGGVKFTHADKVHIAPYRRRK